MIHIYEMLTDVGSLKKGDWIRVKEEDGKAYLVKHPRKDVPKPVFININADIMQRIEVPTTDEVDHTTPKERSELVGYCENDDHWTHFTVGTTPAECEKCKGEFSNTVGFQVQSQRTFNASAKRTRPKNRRK